MRTPEEIKARIEEVEDRDWMGTMRGDLAIRLPFEDAKHLLKEGVTAADWDGPQRTSDEEIKAEILDYMPFAWGKANNNRGLSAGRSMEHMSAWLWLLGMDEAADQVLEYDLYGKPHLRAICEHFGWDWRQWDDGRWTNDEMSDGHAAPETVPPLAA